MAYLDMCAIVNKIHDWWAFAPLWFGKPRHIWKRNRLRRRTFVNYRRCGRAVLDHLCGKLVAHYLNKLREVAWYPSLASFLSVLFADNNIPNLRVLSNKPDLRDLADTLYGRRSK